MLGPCQDKCLQIADKLHAQARMKIRGNWATLSRGVLLATFKYPITGTESEVMLEDPGIKYPEKIR